MDKIKIGQNATHIDPAATHLWTFCSRGNGFRGGRRGQPHRGSKKDSSLVHRHYNRGGRERATVPKMQGLASRVRIATETTRTQKYRVVSMKLTENRATRATCTKCQSEFECQSWDAAQLRKSSKLRPFKNKLFTMDAVVETRTLVCSVHKKPLTQHVNARRYDLVSKSGSRKTKH